MAPGSLVLLTFSSFDLEAMGSHGACWDYVEVNHGTVAEQFCGDTVPGPITSTGNTMTVRFYSDDLFNFPGFRASCRGNDGSLCTITPPGSAPPTTAAAPPPTSAAPPSTSAAPPSSEAPSTFQSPNFPNNYPLGLFQVTIVLIALLNMLMFSQSYLGVDDHAVL